MSAVPPTVMFAAAIVDAADDGQVAVDRSVFPRFGYIVERVGARFLHNRVGVDGRGVQLVVLPAGSVCVPGPKR